MSALPGVGGSLFPRAFLARRSETTVGVHGAAIESVRRQFASWWQRVESTCGPTTGLRALFDLVAMPFASLLGYRAHDAMFERDVVRVRLEGAESGSVQLLVLPWATRPSRQRRNLQDPLGSSADWAIVLAPPFVSVVDTRGHAFRRSADFRLPDAIDARSFHAFWVVCHAGTLLTPAAARLLLEAARFQDGVRQDLQVGVVSALRLLAPVLGQRGSRQSQDDRFAEALTLVYRILFLLFAESREMAPLATTNHGKTYAIGALCRYAASGAAERAGLWDGLAAITRLSRAGCDAADFVATPFNGRLFSRAAAPALESVASTRPTRMSARRDEALAQSLIALATRQGPAGRENISYADLGVEQLGAVYERVLDLDPDDALAAAARLSRTTGRAHSRRRKETGTFYTPRPLAEFVVRRTLAPLVEHATTDDILALRIVDPAMGSGAFLVAACRFLADAYERALVDEGRCNETDLDADERARIRRLVASRCLAGVDANPVAVQLARLSLWLATLARDKPLSFFDHQLRCGDSLLGASPDDLWRLTDAPRGRQAPTPLFDAAGLESAIRSIASPWRHLRSGSDDTLREVHERERLWARLEGTHSPLAPWRQACDVWCARWFWKSTATGPSSSELRHVLDTVLNGGRDCCAGPSTAHAREWILRAREIAATRRFFHWPIEFADLFYDDEGAPRARAGFHAVIGNPPWEMLRGGDPARKDLVSFIRGSGLYPSCDRGHLNLYQPFLERSLALVRPGGRVGLVLPWGAAVDEGTSTLRRRLLRHDRFETLVGLDNCAGLFPIHRGLRFLVMVIAPGLEPRRIQAKFGVRTAKELDELPGRDDPEEASCFPIKLDADTLAAAGGPALRIPDVRHRGDLEWLVEQSRRHPRLGDQSGWNVRFGRELNATEDRGAFGPAGLPVIEGKHIAPFQVDLAATTRYIQESRAARLLPSRPFDSPRLAYRDVAGVGNRLTLIAAIVPPGVVTTHSLFCLRGRLPADQQLFLCALFNSSSLNRIVRMLMGGHVTTGLVEHLPVPRWTGDRDQLRLAELAKCLGSDAMPSDADLASMQQEIDLRVGHLYNPTHGA